MLVALARDTCDGQHLENPNRHGKGERLLIAGYTPRQGDDFPYPEAEAECL